MNRRADERALWLAKHVLPHEPALRAWLGKRDVVGLEIDDVIQETYAKLITTPSVDDIRNPRAYAFQAAYSVLVTHVRRSKIVSIEAVSNIDQLGALAGTPSPEQEVAARDELRLLAKAIAALPNRVGTVFTLRKVHGLSQREVAQRLGLSESTVEKHMSRGLQLLADRFGRGGKPFIEASSGMKEDLRASRIKRDRSSD